jgi:hypothetical protein
VPDEEGVGTRIGDGGASRHVVAGGGEVSTVGGDRAAEPPCTRLRARHSHADGDVEQAARVARGCVPMPGAQLVVRGKHERVAQAFEVAALGCSDCGAAAAWLALEQQDLRAAVMAGDAGSQQRQLRVTPKQRHAHLRHDAQAPSRVKRVKRATRRSVLRARSSVSSRPVRARPSPSTSVRRRDHGRARRVRGRGFPDPPPDA